MSQKKKGKKKKERKPISIADIEDEFTEILMSEEKEKKKKKKKKNADKYATEQTTTEVGWERDEEQDDIINLMNKADK